MGRLMGDERAEELYAMDLRLGPMRMTIPTAVGIAVDRRAFDARLVNAAVTRGAEFVSGTSAAALPLSEGRIIDGLC